MPAKGDLRDSATERKPPLFSKVRVKGCGKSAPRLQQCGRHGKPRQEQDQIGTTRFRSRSEAGPCRPGRSGRSRELSRKVQPRGMIAILSFWARYRTRLTGCLIQIIKNPSIRTVLFLYCSEMVMFVTEFCLKMGCFYLKMSFRVIASHLIPC